MNRFNWTYVDSRGHQNRIGLMHGAQSGHLLIYCNTKIILIDFKVLQSKTYSVFIEDELCEISIERKENKFYYGFDINKKADTPLNRSRKETDKKHLFQSLLFVGAFFSCIALVVYFFFNGVPKKSTPIDINYTDTTFAKIFLIDKDYIKYSFIAKDQTYSFPQNINQKEIFPLSAFPLQNGDEFQVTYDANNPKRNKLLLENPTNRQLEKYASEAAKIEAATHYTIDVKKANCRIEIAYELEGIKGLAKFYNQNKSSQENPLFNELTYKKLTRDIPFQQKAEENCW